MTFFCRNIPQFSNLTIPPAIRGTFLAFAISINRAFFASLVSGWYFLHSFRTLAA